MKTFFSLIILFTLLLSCQSENKSSKQKENHSENKNNSTTQTENKKTPSVQTVTGKGDEVKKIELNEGLSIFKLEYTGKRNFSVWLKDSDGNNLELLVNTLDQYTGSKSVNIKKTGSYILEVKSYGNWKIEIEN